MAEVNSLKKPLARLAVVACLSVCASVCGTLPAMADTEEVINTRNTIINERERIKNGDYTNPNN